jgi:hypothetical protein
MNFSTHPAWMFAQEKTFAVATDPDAVQWNYAQGKEVLDPAGKEMASTPPRPRTKLCTYRKWLRIPLLPIYGIGGHGR